MVAIKALLAEGKHFSTIKAYERGSDAGGAWNHSPVGAKNSAVDLINNGSAYDDRLQAVNGSGHSWHFPTPMYNELNTNTPARLMSFNNVDFPQNTEAFPKRQAVLQYLRQHAQDVSTYISFDQEVVSVRKDQEKQIWTVQSRPNTTSADVVTQTEDFDRVVIASGHYDVPKLPNIPGMKVFDTLFPGTIHHSKYYRTPTEYTNQTVLVVGSGPSAIDITSQIARVTSPTRIFWSQRTPSTFPIPAASEGVQQVAEIERMASNGCIHLKDGRALSNIDRVLFCTGYLYSFPYLDQSTLPRQSPLVTNGERLHNLYEHLFYIPDPTLAVLAMNMSKSISGKTQHSRAWILTVQILYRFVSRRHKLVTCQESGQVV